ncbi:maker54 [Drosophila busckii]|uniref:Maker54 n=1 Tax=Drosophila busckii TaxID=30019 RepID=A0A0M4EC82_DROBS|nr:extensin [Drosophila busckii]ALC41290.1 maker54 [Drosophila busckii]
MKFILLLLLGASLVLSQDIEPQIPEDLAATTTVETAESATQATEPSIPTTPEAPTTLLDTTTTAASTPGPEYLPPTPPTPGPVYLPPTLPTPPPPPATGYEPPADPLPTRPHPPAYQPPQYPHVKPPYYYPKPTHAQPPYYYPRPMQHPLPTQRPCIWHTKVCYLREQLDYHSNYGVFDISSWLPTYNCYSCCYYGYNSFAGCNKLHNGRCNLYNAK